MKILYKILLLAIGLTYGCTTLPPESPEKDQKHKSFLPPGNQLSGIYIYRNEFLGLVKHLGINIDGQLSARTQGYTYIYAELPPGQHTIVSEGHKSTDVLMLETLPNHLYYIHQEIKGGSPFRNQETKLHLVEPTEGQKGVLESSAVKTHVIPSELLYTPVSITSNNSTIIGDANPNTLGDESTVFVRAIDGKLTRSGRNGWATPLPIAAGFHQVILEFIRGGIYANASVEFEAKPNTEYQIRYKATDWTSGKLHTQFWLTDNTGRQVSNIQQGKWCFHSNHITIPTIGRNNQMHSPDKVYNRLKALLHK